jgi:hypothetical protein
MSIDGVITLYHAIRGLGEIEGVALASVSSYSWFRDTVSTFEIEKVKMLGGSAFDYLNELAAQAPPGRCWSFWMEARPFKRRQKLFW